MIERKISMKKIYNKIKNTKLETLIILILLTILSSISIFHKGIIINHDVNFHLHRIIALSDNINIGKYIPVYFNYLNGFGYGNGLFYPDLFLYIPSILYNLGICIEISYKTFILIINFFALLNMYLCVKKITNDKKCSYIAIILYSIANYRMLDLVERGALGEVMAFVFLPLIILGIYEIFFGNYKKTHYFIIGMCGMCLSHVISFYLTCIILIIFTIINIKCLKNKKRLYNLIISIIISLLITSYFWLPMIEQLINNELNIISIGKIYKYVVPLSALFIDFCIIYMYEEWVPAGIGIIYYVSIILYIKQLKQNKFKIKNKFLFTLFILSIICILLIICPLIWKIEIMNKIFGVIQFPWRLYMFTTTFLIISLSIFLKEYKITKLIKLLFIYTLLIFIVNSLLYTINVYRQEPLKNQIMLGEYLPKNFDLKTTENYENNDIKYTRKKQYTYIEIKEPKDKIEAPLIYYKGYKACDENKCYKVYKNQNGLLGIKTDENTTKIKISYEGTNIYKISKYISFIGLTIFIIKCIKKKDDQNEQIS